MTEMFNASALFCGRIMEMLQCCFGEVCHSGKLNICGNKRFISIYLNSHNLSLLSHFDDFNKHS
jgi:hypothetical protein